MHIYNGNEATDLGETHLILCHSCAQIAVNGDDTGVSDDYAETIREGLDFIAGEYGHITYVGSGADPDTNYWADSCDCCDFDCSDDGELFAFDAA